MKVGRRALTSPYPKDIHEFKTRYEARIEKLTRRLASLNAERTPKLYESTRKDLQAAERGLRRTLEVMRGQMGGSE